MYRLLNQTIVAATFAAMLGATPSWAEEAEDTSDRETTSKEDSCIYVPGINGFNPIDNRHLTVGVGASKTYLLTLRHICHDLRWTEDIAYDSTLTWSCTNTKDKIIVKGFSCFIDTIEQVEDHAAAKALVAERKQAAEEEK